MTIEIFTAILTSSFLSAGLTAWVNWRIQNNNYKNDFYKKLLDKRIKAYESVERLICSLKQLVHIKESELCNQFCYLGKDHFDRFIISITAQDSFWLNDDISGKITQFNIFIIQKISYKIDKTKNPDEELIRLGIVNRDKIKEKRLELEDLLYQDLKGLHKIKSFIKNRKPDSQYPLFDNRQNSN